jgi:putative transposase
VGTRALERNERVLIGEVTYTLRRLISATCWQLEDPRTGRIIEKEKDVLEQGFFDGTVKFAPKEDDRPHSPTNVEPTEREKAMISVRLQYVRAVEYLPVNGASFEDAIALIWANAKKTHSKEQVAVCAHKPSWITVYRWLSRYRRFGKDSYALLYRKRNRAVSFPEEVIEILDEALEVVYLTLERNTLQDSLDYARQRVHEINEIRTEQELAPLKIPSRRLIKAMLRDIPAFDRYAARFGWQAARNKFRSVKGHRVTKCPLERAEIDHTPLDLFVIDDQEMLPLGRPYVTVCIDDFTRCVLGIYVGFVPPSYLSVAHCLKHAFLPKPASDPTFPKTVNRWISYGVTRELVVDQALEFHADSFEEGCRRLGIEIHYSPRKTAWFKGKIERFLRTLNEGVAHGVRGTTFSNIIEKGDYNPEKWAVVRLSTLRAAIHMWVCDLYHQKKHRALGVPPVVMWERHVKPQDLRMPESREVLDAIMGRRYRRVLSHKGIEFNGLSYSSDALSELRNRFGSRLDVEICVDESDIGSIYVHYQDEFVQAQALNLTYADGISLWQHKLFQERAESYNPKGWLTAKEKIRRMYEEDFKLFRRISRGRAGRALEGVKTNRPPTDMPALLTASTNETVAFFSESHIALADEMPTDRPRYEAIRLGDVND